LHASVEIEPGRPVLASGVGEPLPAKEAPELDGAGSRYSPESPHEIGAHDAPDNFLMLTF